MTANEKEQLTALAEVATAFVQTLTEYEARAILAGRMQIVTVAACPECRHNEADPWAHCHCQYEECGCEALGESVRQMTGGKV